MTFVSLKSMLVLITKLFCVYTLTNDNSLVIKIAISQTSVDQLRKKTYRTSGTSWQHRWQKLDLKKIVEVIKTYLADN